MRGQETEYFGRDMGSNQLELELSEDYEWAYTVKYIWYIFIAYVSLKQDIAGHSFAVHLRGF